jgi:ribosomal protein S8
MNSTNIWKKRLNNKREKESNRIVNRRHFKSKKKKKVLSNFLKENLITNWIENEGDDEQSESSIDLNYFHKNCQIKTTNQDEDSLHIENLQRLSTMKNIIFLDLDNFSSFFQHLTNDLPDQTYIMAFQGSNIQWKPPKKFTNFNIFIKIESLF